MLQNQDLCLAVVVGLAIAALGQATPLQGRVVNGTNSSVLKYPFVVSRLTRLSWVMDTIYPVSRYLLEAMMAPIPAAALLFPSTL